MNASTQQQQTQVPQFTINRNFHFTKIRETLPEGLTVGFDGSYVFIPGKEPIHYPAFGTLEKLGYIVLKGTAPVAVRANPAGVDFRPAVASATRAGNTNPNAPNSPPGVKFDTRLDAASQGIHIPLNGVPAATNTEQAQSNNAASSLAAEASRAAAEQPGVSTLVSSLGLPPAKVEIPLDANAKAFKESLQKPLVAGVQRVASVQGTPSNPAPAPEMAGVTQLEALAPKAFVLPPKVELSGEEPEGGWGVFPGFTWSMRGNHWKRRVEEAMKYRDNLVLLNAILAVESSGVRDAVAAKMTYASR